ncbi:hypothetical protein Y032_0023g870 [Ancylostoma ceylanicum]|uniref:Uncharacterized protein n=1 Tax=Ancylostoma ceylanicum TaxID=53326 RepID=A0A016UY74_9BILA|nr:hypothetical protein Y032_0023g870 [Ancylostoma ceylanicum]
MTPPSYSKELLDQSSTVLAMSARDSTSSTTSVKQKKKSGSRPTAPVKRRKRDFTSSDSLVTEGQLNSRLAELSKTFIGELEAVKTVINIHVDEIEQEVRNLRSDLQKLNLPQAMNDIKAFMQRMILLECEIKQTLEELGVNRRLERLDKRLDTLHDIKEMVEAWKGERRERRRKRSVSAATDVVERARCQVSPVPERQENEEERLAQEVKGLQAEMATYNRKLVKTRHEIQAILYRIEEAWKKVDVDPTAVRRVDDMKKEKHRLRAEESDIRKTIDQIRDRLRECWERQQRQHRSPQAGPSRRGV